MTHRRLIVALLAPSCLLPSCGSTVTRDGPTAVDASEPQTPLTQAWRTPLIVDGTPVAWEALRPALVELAGGQAVEETSLDLLLAEEASRRGIELTDEMVRAEREDLLRSLDAEDADTAAALLEELRRRRGLGPERFERLMARNAVLRALVEDGVEVTEDDLRTAHAARHGPRKAVRAIVLATEREAAAVRERLAGTPVGLEARFIDAALDASIDPSAPVGGLLDPISFADPAYPVAVRTAVRDTPAGAMTPVVAVDGGFAVLYVREQIPADGTTLEDVRGELEDDLLTRKTRLAMESLARELLSGGGVTALEPSLNWAWRTRTGNAF